MRYKLMELRQAKGLSQSSMAKLCKISAMAYYRIEHNLRNGEFLVWMRIKQTYKIKDDEIIQMYMENSKERKQRGRRK